MIWVQKGSVKLYVVFFVIFGAPVEISLDRGPEFSTKVTKDFLKRWGVHHRMSSAYHPMSNGRTELAVKATKRLLMENVGSNGELNNNRMVLYLRREMRLIQGANCPLHRSF